MNNVAAARGNGLRREVYPSAPSTSASQRGAARKTAAGGGLLSFGLLVMALAPILAGRWRQRGSHGSRPPIPESRAFEEAATGAQFRDLIAIRVKASPDATEPVPECGWHRP
jgi:hypothetical protein